MKTFDFVFLKVDSNLISKTLDLYVENVFVFFQSENSL